MNLVERSSQLKNKVFEALEKDPALLMLTGPENIYELAVPEGLESQPPYIVVQELEYRTTEWADGHPIQDSTLYQIDVYHNQSCDPIMAAIMDVMGKLDFQTTVLINEFLQSERLIRKGYRFEANILL
ncbi:phage protein [Bacillus amyloliquefaciens]|uniref:tail completion protein gp17 n=1 Tax=Bacillus amyloliquefaciens TaxID=1390 RepID=UPI0018CDB132|nr:phage protein [Bacillus amyloliquefaciens]